jgi:hypothetical protein
VLHINLKVARCQGTVFSSAVATTVDAASHAGWWPSTPLDASGRRCVAHRNAVDDPLVRLAWMH